MSARALLVAYRGMLEEQHGADKVAEMLTPRTPAEARAERLAQLRSLGVDVA